MTAFFISDTHFGHKNILKFKTQEGNPVRDFKSVEEMDELIISNWNKTVHPKDTVYHLGDVCMSYRHLKTVQRLNGRKILIAGNHDMFKAKDILKYFVDVRSYKVYSEYGIICSHIPIHSDSLHRWKLNVHGHTHSYNVQGYIEEFDINQDPYDDSRYLNVCVEKINYTPISLDSILELMKYRFLKTKSDL